MKVDTQQQGRIFDIYKKKNNLILRSGYAESFDTLFAANDYEVLGAASRPLVFFNKGKMRKQGMTLLFNFLVLDPLVVGFIINFYILWLVIFS